MEQLYIIWEEELGLLGTDYRVFKLYSALFPALVECNRRNEESRFNRKCRYVVTEEDSEHVERYREWARTQKKHGTRFGKTPELSQEEFDSIFEFEISRFGGST